MDQKADAETVTHTRLHEIGTVDTYHFELVITLDEN